MKIVAVECVTESLKSEIILMIFVRQEKTDFNEKMSHVYAQHFALDNSMK